VSQRSGDWIEDFEIKTASQFSNVALIESNDRKRFEQFVMYAHDTRFNEKGSLVRFERLLVFDEFHGLREVTGDKEGLAFGELDWKTIEDEEEDDFSIDIGGDSPAMTLNESIHYLHEASNLSTDDPQAHCLILDIEAKQVSKLARILSYDIELTQFEHTVVVFAPEMNDIPENTRNLCINIEPDISTYDDREAILKGLAGDFNFDVNGSIINAFAGLNLHETQSIAMESLMRYGGMNLRIVADYKKSVIERSGVLEVLPPLKGGFKAIGGYQEVIDYTGRAIIKPLMSPEKAKALGKELPKGVILFGFWGTGKSIFVRALAYELDMPVLSLKMSNIKDKYVGESGKRLKKALNYVDEISPCILFIDEIDQIGSRGNASLDGGTQNEVFTQFISWLAEPRDSILFGTTNEPDNLDPALIRAGRTDYMIPFMLPDVKARSEIFKVHTEIQRNVPLAKDVDLGELAEITQSMTGAEVELLVKRAVDIAFSNDCDQVQQDHFLEAINSYEINLDDRQKKISHFMKLAERYVTDSSFKQDLKSKYAVRDRKDKFKEKMEART